MTFPQQRFCPICDRAFIESEAVLRCGGCGVMHHPACWVSHGGCATQAEHEVSSVAVAYTTGRPITSVAPPPAEPPRRPQPRPAYAPDEPVGATPPPPPVAPRPVFTPEDDDLPASVPEPTAVRVQPRELEPPIPPVPPRRYVPPAADVPAARKPLPKIYGRPPIFDYWYIPAAVILAIAVAAAVVWVAGKLFGGDSNTNEPQPTATAAATAPPAASPSASASASPTTSGAAASTRFKVGDIVTVTGAGPAPECLNVRVSPGRTNTAISCVDDGTQLKVTGGPEKAGDLVWWKVLTTQGEGWAAEDYLVKKP